VVLRTGWGPGFKLLDSPETRRANLRAKCTTLLVVALIAAYCCRLLTLPIIRFGWLGTVLGVAGVLLTGAIGPPRWHPGFGCIRILVALCFGSPLFIVTASLLWLSEFGLEFFDRRLHAAGRGGGGWTSSTAARPRSPVRPWTTWPRSSGLPPPRTLYLVGPPTSAKGHLFVALGGQALAEVRERLRM
jgi:hypothetical protein